MGLEESRIEIIILCSAAKNCLEAFLLQSYGTSSCVIISSWEMTDVSRKPYVEINSL